MAIFRCKMCGGDLEIVEGASTCTCTYCGREQTLPTVKDEEIQILFNRANVLRMKSEFDKASEIYEKILQSDETEAEAYWGLILCKYGIEYVVDPVSSKRIPTCHRASYDAVVADEDYKNALKYADTVQQTIYETDAKEIDEVQKDIIALVRNEEPYDIFICYKETDESGKRTQDSTIANEIYHQLVNEGYKVFYAAISLEDKLGKEYEPFIFSALNTSKIMLVIGTKPEYFNAVWVRNEWSRFMKIMKNDRSKLLIPCYRDFDPYELPEEFVHLQAQDMSKIGFVNDIIRSIKKIIVKDSPKYIPQEYTTSGSTVDTQLKRGNIALEDKDWEKADNFYEEALNLNPECAEAYIGKLLAREKVSSFSSWLNFQKDKYNSFTVERLEACPEDTAHISNIIEEYKIDGYLDEGSILNEYVFDRGYNSGLSCRKNQKEKQLEELASERLLTRAQQYAKGNTKEMIESGFNEIIQILDERILKAQKADEENISQIMSSYSSHIVSADKKIEEMKLNAKNLQEKCYQSAINKMDNALDIPAFESARDAFKEMNGYKDSFDLANKCNKEIERLKEEARQEKERRLVIRKNKAKVKKRMVVTAIVTAVVCTFAFMVCTKIIIPKIRYNSAVTKYGKETADLLENINIGDTYTFGSYLQDSTDSNEKKDIEWIVLDRDGSKLLLISKYVLDCQPYHTVETEDVTWETCSLRKWLNETFINNAFTLEENSKIAEVTIKASKNPKYSTSAGNDTLDRIFLLSIDEAKKYFSSDNERICHLTNYAYTQGALTNSIEGMTFWWLRSPGDKGNMAVDVYDDGSIFYEGNLVNLDCDGVRPALWIDLHN